MLNFAGVFFVAASTTWISLSVSLPPDRPPRSNQVASLPEDKTLQQSSPLGFNGWNGSIGAYPKWWATPVWPLPGNVGNEGLGWDPRA